MAEVFGPRIFLAGNPQVRLHEHTRVPTRQCCEREPADSLSEQTNVIGSWLPSLTFFGHFASDLKTVTVLGYILFGLGCLAGLAGDVRFLVITYRHGLVWFFTCLFIPLVGFFFFVSHFRETWRPVLLSTAGLIVASVGYWIGGFNFLL